MKATGIVRRIDNLGRVVLPIELRRIFDLNREDPVEIYVQDDCIILKKYQKSCIFCDNHENVKDFKGKNVCKNCVSELHI